MSKCTNITTGHHLLLGEIELNNSEVMSMEHTGDKIEDILVNSELAKQLVPDKFKFTSHQGRMRRQKLLLAAKKLSETTSIHDISLADVCTEAGIPRASAYHFFPNVEGIFLALRLINAIELLEELKSVKTEDYDRWQGYVTAFIIKASELLQSDNTKARLIYEENTPDFVENRFGKRIEAKVAKIMCDNLTSQYELPFTQKLEEVMVIAYSIIDAVFRLSFRHHQEITEHYRQEGTTACIAYMRCYLPETLSRKQQIAE